jgi:outer membrane protein OmpA-like peptidoglycan-associated protein
LITVDALEAKTGEHAEKEQTDISRVEEKISFTQANQKGQLNQSAIAANQAAIAPDSAAISTLDKAMTHLLVAKGDVTFGFDKSKLGQTDQAALDALIQQVQSMPRPVFELTGFTDPIGTVDYNLALSRRRADAVASVESASLKCQPAAAVLCDRPSSFVACRAAVQCP